MADCKLLDHEFLPLVRELHLHAFQRRLVHLEQNAGLPSLNREFASDLLIHHGEVLLIAGARGAITVIIFTFLTTHGPLLLPQL